MSAAPWQVRLFLVLLLGSLWGTYVMLVVGLLLAVHYANLPGWLELTLGSLLASFLVPGFKATRQITKSKQQR